MYDELIAELRQHHCDAEEDDTQEVCEECAYDVIIADESVPSGFASVCVCGLMNRAADAIEELVREHITNADRIRAMTDEELAADICRLELLLAKHGHRGFHAWLDWLRQEVVDA